MKIIELSADGGVRTATATLIRGSRGPYYALSHGEEGRGRWQYRLPLSTREFPASEQAPASLPLDGEFRLVDLQKKDPRGNPLYLLARGEDDGAHLVLWHLSPGFRGGASWRVEGQVEVLALGEEAQGAAGRVGGADCPVVLATGPCRLHWTRTGRLYGDPADWIAEYDGHQWTVGPAAERALEDAAFDWAEDGPPPRRGALCAIWAIIGVSSALVRPRGAHAQDHRGGT